MERIDVRGDLLGLIHTQRNIAADNESLWSSHIFFGANLSHISALPLPPTNRQLSVELLPELPCYLDDEAASVYLRMTLLRKRSQLPKPAIFGSTQGLGVYDGRPDEGSRETETPESCEKGESEWYECAEDALTQLVNLQNFMRQHWLDLISEFNFEEIPSSSSPSGLCLESGDEKIETEEENFSELISLREQLDTEIPSPEAIRENVKHVQNTDVIMASWGLLDLVQMESLSVDEGSQHEKSNSPSAFSHSNDLLSLESGSLL
jgi:hypothetical protein